MHWGTTLFLLCLPITLSRATLFSVERLRQYARILRLDSLAINETGNELWHGLFRDCDKRVTFSCIQKNAYTYLDNAFIERDNITVFDGLVLTRNNVTYDACPRAEHVRHDIRENLVDDDADVTDNCNERTEEKSAEEDRSFRDKPDSPLEEIADALRQKTVKFLSTRNYQIQLPQFFFEGITMKISPREIDENGALLRVDFEAPIVQQQGRILFKKIKKFIQNRLLSAFLALLLIIKLIKVKFLFVIPFLFGVGAAKKLFLKLLLFFIPTFAHIFKLCSSYHTAHGTKYHHHHHQIAHHHHHVPVPVAIPYHHHHHEDEYDGYEYSHPHIQYRKDMEELKEWGIETHGYDESYPEDPSQHLNHRVVPGSVPASASGNAYSGSYGLPQYAASVKPLAASSYLDNAVSASAHNLAYSGYLNDVKYNRRPAQQPPVNPGLVSAAAKPPAKNPYAVFAPNLRPAHHHHHQQQQQQQHQQRVAAAKSVTVSRQEAEDEYYGPIVARLEDIFGQLRFHEESCREMLICSMYKNPTGYSPHSNIVSHELSRDPQELKRDGTESASSQKFYRYLSAARHGQDGGDCLRTYPCRSNAQ